VPNPLIPQGNVSLLVASVTVPSFTALNVTPSYLGRNGIELSFDGEATLIIQTLTGTVTSPQPYQMVTVRISLLKSQALSQTYEAQRQSQSVIGNITVRPDTTTLQPYDLYNCAIESVGALQFSGQNADYGVTIRGYYPTNSSLWG
jgi:hypothetical protein